MRIPSEEFEKLEKRLSEEKSSEEEYKRDLSLLQSGFDKKFPYSEPYSRWLERFKMGRCKDQEATAKRNEFIHNLIRSDEKEYNLCEVKGFKT